MKFTLVHSFSSHFLEMLHKSGSLVERKKYGHFLPPLPSLLIEILINHTPNAASSLNIQLSVIFPFIEKGTIRAEIQAVVATALRKEHLLVIHPQDMCVCVIPFVKGNIFIIYTKA